MDIYAFKMHNTVCVRMYVEKKLIVDSAGIEILLKGSRLFPLCIFIFSFSMFSISNLSFEFLSLLKKKNKQMITVIQ